VQPTEADRLTTSIEELDIWMVSNQLQLNLDKTQFIWVDSCQQLANGTVTEILIDGHNITTSTMSRLGVVIDAELTFAMHVNRVASRCFYQLCQAMVSSACIVC